MSSLVAYSTIIYVGGVALEHMERARFHQEK